MPISNNIQVDVFLSGASDTSVRTLGGSNQVAVGYGSQDVTVSLGGGSTTDVAQASSQVNIGMAGIQGPASESVYGRGSDQQIQYNRLGFVSGAKTFLYIPETDEAMVDEGLFTMQDSRFKISGTNLEVDKFVIKNIHNTNQELFRIDAAGNMAATANLYITGDFIPAQSGVSDLGSHKKPFGELYLQGDSVNFVDANASIKAGRKGFNFFLEGTNAQGQTELKNIFTVLTGIGGNRISGIASFVEGFDASNISNLQYTGIIDNGVFIEQAIPKNSDTVTVNFGETLSYTPKVLCSMVPPEGSNELYFTFVEDITTSNCKAVFSSRIVQEGYKLNCFVSPRDV